MSTCTIIARNYLAYARVLATSYARHHGGERMSVLVIDGDVHDGAARLAADEPFEVVLPSQLPIAGDEFRRMASIYDVMELATALKPGLLRFLLDRGSETAMYLDPDIEVFAALDDLDRLAREHAIVLIPHTVRPIPPDGRKPTFADLAEAGVYNLGFIAVGRASRAFLDWWAEHLRRNCLMAPEERLFVDQRFIDFAPAFFTAHVARDPGCNVAYWNLHERRVTRNGGGYEVAGVPLRFFHFSGFNPTTPLVLSKHQGTTARTALTEQPELARLCREYADRLRAAGYQQCIAVPYGFASTANGVPLDRRMRRVYREGLLAAERGAHAEPPGPFDPDEARKFIEWTKARGALEAMPARSRAALLIHEGPYLGSRSAPVRLVQRVLLRILRPLLIHQEGVARALLQALDEEMSEQAKGRRASPE